MSSVDDQHAMDSFSFWLQNNRSATKVESGKTIFSEEWVNRTPNLRDWNPTLYH
eukprot:gene9367-10342_t